MKIPDPHDFEPEGLNPRRAAIWLGVSVSTLERWRAQGTGPKYVQEPGGRLVIYPVDELRAWLRERAR